MRSVSLVLLCTACACQSRRLKAAHAAAQISSLKDAAGSRGKLPSAPGLVNARQAERSSQRMLSLLLGMHTHPAVAWQAASRHDCRTARYVYSGCCERFRSAALMTSEPRKVQSGVGSENEALGALRGSIETGMQYSSTSGQSQQVNLMTVADQAWGRKQLLSVLGIAGAAVTLFLNSGEARAEEVATVLKDVLDVLDSPSVSEGTAAAAPFLSPSNPPPLSADSAQALATSAKESAVIGESSVLAAIIQKSLQEALVGGEAGLVASVIQTVVLTWLFTTLYYQYKYGGDLASTVSKLYNEGGFPRLNKGLGVSLVETPLLKFGDVAANVGVLALLDSFETTAALPVVIRTAIAALSAGAWRFVCQPIDTLRVAVQVEGEQGWVRLKDNVLQKGPGPLYQGALAASLYTIASDYPFFLTYNFLNGQLPVVSKEETALFLLRSAVLGVSGQCVSGVATNFLAVIKTVQQTSGLSAPEPSARKGVKQNGDVEDGKISIVQATQLVLETGGVRDLFGRGLDSRFLISFFQGAIFGTILKYFQTA